MRARRLLNQRCAKHLLNRSFPFPRASAFVASCAVLIVALFLTPLVVPSHAQQKEKLPRPRRLDESLALRRDPATGELTSNPAPGNSAADANATRPIAVVTQIVPVMCNVIGADGVAVRGLQREDFRVFDDGVPQPITYFDASTESASVALVLDASPSVLRESDEMKNAARALVDALSSSDQTAVVDFSAHTYLQVAVFQRLGADTQSCRARGCARPARRRRRLEYLRSRFSHRARSVRQPHRPQSHRAAHRWTR